MPNVSNKLYKHYWYLHQVEHSSRWTSQTKQKLSVHLDSRGVKQRQRGVKKTKENERDDDDDDDDECKGGKPKLKHWLKVGDRHYKQKRLADKYRYFRNKTNPVNHHRSSHATPTHATSPGPFPPLSYSENSINNINKSSHRQCKQTRFSTIHVAGC